MWFELGASDGDVERLVGLGATRLRDGVLADPDGNEFSVRAEG
ncbi:MAG TPA: VOC family protein [Nocardioides sp.]|nr:VOC family protein [Nocardioides sp.]